jgi:hypothetical protein
MRCARSLNAHSQVNSGKHELHGSEICYGKQVEMEEFLGIFITLVLLISSIAIWFSKPITISKLTITKASAQFRWIQHLVGVTSHQFLVGK